MGGENRVLREGLAALLHMHMHKTWLRACGTTRAERMNNVNHGSTIRLHMLSESFRVSPQQLNIPCDTGHKPDLQCIDYKSPRPMHVPRKRQGHLSPSL